MELALLLCEDRRRIRASPDELFGELEANPLFPLLPLTVDIAVEMLSLGNASLRDPADRAIVATTRVHRLTPVIFDQRIIEPGLVPVVE
jgi:PIN domain nuclease of toxin-antitoxin system